MFFALDCPVCGAPGRVPCRRCEASLAPAPSLALPPGVDHLVALCDYDEAGRALVHAMKFGNSRATARWAAGRAAERLVAAGDLEPGWTLTWAPTSAERRRARGFDQAERLARLLGRRLGVRAVPLLTRAPGEPQTGRSADDRWLGPHFRARRRLGSPSIVMVDDVVTTGATVSAAARALRSAGARQVWCVAVARTTFKPRAPRADDPANAGDQLPGHQDAGRLGS